MRILNSITAQSKRLPRDQAITECVGWRNSEAFSPKTPFNVRNPSGDFHFQISSGPSSVL
jgi:hypothetical protein